MKKYVSIVMSILLVFAMISCASASGVKSEKERNLIDYLARILDGNENYMRLSVEDATIYENYEWNEKKNGFDRGTATINVTFNWPVKNGESMTLIMFDLFYQDMVTYMLRQDWRPSVCFILTFRSEYLSTPSQYYEVIYKVMADGKGGYLEGERNILITSRPAN